MAAPYNKGNAFGTNTLAAFTQGNSNSAIGNFSNAQGQGTISYAEASHSEGGETQASGFGSHAEGLNTNTLSQFSHAEGYLTKTSGYESHAEGHETLTLGSNSHAEGYLTTAFGNESHAEGGATESYGTQSHSEGQHTTAYGNYSHAEGNGTTAYGNYSHAEGYSTTANAEYSHAEGRWNIANFEYETVVGRSNSADELFGPANASPYFQVGVGNGNQANGLSVCSDSNTYIPINGMQTPLNSYAQRTLDIQLYMLTAQNPAVNYSYYSKNGLEVGNMALAQGSSSISLSTIASKLTSWNGVDNIIARRSTDITESTAPLGLNIKTDDGFLDPFIPISLTVFPTINTTASAHPITINFTNSIASAWLVAIYAKSYAGTHTGTTAANIWTRYFNGTSTTDYKIINFMTNIASADGGGTKILYINGLYNYL